MTLEINFYQGQITHEPIKLGLSFLLPHRLDTTHLCMKFHDFVSSSSIVMTPDLKTRPMTDGQDDDSARTVVNRPFFVESFTLQL